MKADSNNEETLQEQELVRRFQSGDEAAFKELYEKLYSPLAYFAMQMIGNQFEAEDYAIKALYSVYKKREQFNTFPNVRGYLYLTVRNLCYNYRKQVKNRSVLLKKAMATEETSYEQQYLDEVEAEVIRKLKEAVDSLPRECQRVFKMLFFEEMATKDVAKALNITVPTVRSTKRKALILLRTKLTPGQLVTAYFIYSTYRELGEKVIHKIPMLY